jgi:hypothetical protein
MGLEVLLVALALVPLGALLGLYLYITHGARTSHLRRRKRNRRALRRVRQRDHRVLMNAPPHSDKDDTGPWGSEEDYLDHAEPSDAYFEAGVLDDDDGGALARGLLEDDVDISEWTDDRDAGTDH